MSEGIPEAHLVYARHAAAYDRLRSRSLQERAYLDAVQAGVPASGEILDLGCGMGEPIARHFIELGHRVTGVDAAPAMIARCRERFPDQHWLEADMRGLTLDRHYDAVIAWDSFFHLDAHAQRAMFPVFATLLPLGGMLLFTSGPAAGVALGKFAGETLFHASLDAGEYRALLARAGFLVVLHVVEDPACGGHTVWLARRTAAQR